MLALTRNVWIRFKSIKRIFWMKNDKVDVKFLILPVLISINLTWINPPSQMRWIPKSEIHTPGHTTCTLQNDDVHCSQNGFLIIPRRIDWYPYKFNSTRATSSLILMKISSRVARCTEFSVGVKIFSHFANFVQNFEWLTEL